MFIVTAPLREHLVKAFSMKPDATEEEATKLAATKYAAGELTGEKLKELGKTATDKTAELATVIAMAVAAEVAKHIKPAEPKTAEVPVVKETEDDKMAVFEAKMKAMEASLDQKAAEFDKRIQESNPAPRGIDILRLGVGIDKDDSPISIRFKALTEKYKTTTTKATRESKTSSPEHKIIRRHGSYGEQLDNPSEYRRAMGAVWFKYMLAPHSLTENDLVVLNHILHKEAFIIHGHSPDVGAYNPEVPEAPRLLDAKERHDMLLKATVVIHDATSGGQYATPEFFDTDFILLPILGSELAPLCNIVDVPRGAAAQNFTLGNPSWTSGSTEGTAITPFTTDSLIGNKDVTFWRAAGAIRMGLNFLEDAVPGFADAIASRILAKANEWLDEQVAIGDGTTEPEGIFVTSGTVDVTLNTPTTGPYVVGDLLELLFGVTKAYRTAYPSNRAAFVMTDVAYASIRAIATGLTGDARLLFGMDVESYMLLGHPVAIVGTGLTNDKLAFLQAGGYRLYRRQGPRFRRSTEGSTNILANMMLLAYDMRFGGQLDRGGYAAVTNSGVP